MSAKLLVSCMAATVIAGGAAAAVTAAASITPTASTPGYTVAPVVFGAPLPLDPAADVPTPDQLNGVLIGLADPGVSYCVAVGDIDRDRVVGAPFFSRAHRRHRLHYAGEEPLRQRVVVAWQQRTKPQLFVSQLARRFTDEFADLAF